MPDFNFTLGNILQYWIPLGFGLIGVFTLLIGLLNLINGKDNSFRNIFSGLFVIAIAIGLGFLMTAIVVPYLENN